MTEKKDYFRDYIDGCVENGEMKIKNEQVQDDVNKNRKPIDEISGEKESATVRDLGGNTRYADLENRLNQLNQSYLSMESEYSRVVQSRTYRVAIKVKKLLIRLHLLSALKFVLDVRRFGIKAAIHGRKLNCQIRQNGQKQLATVCDGEMGCEKNLSPDQKWRKRHTAALKNNLEHAWLTQSRQISNVIADTEYCGIVVFPHAVHWDPIQRPQHILREFAQRGYLCFFCEPAEKEKCICKVEERLYIVYGEEYLLPVLQNECPIVLITYHNQSVFCDLLPQKYIWFDVLDNLDFFANGNEPESRSIYKKLVRNANLVSYSADNLKPYISSRKDALKLNNGVTISDFQRNNQKKAISELAALKSAGKHIIGYYGSIEEWFDVGAIHAILKKTDLEVVLIGRCGIDLSELKCNRLHLLGEVPYGELANYAQYFDIACVPFVVNRLTNSVSPVKFFEYAAQGLPVVSSAIHEMLAYESDAVRIYRNYEELIRNIQGFLEHPVDKQILYTIAEQNTWKSRVDLVEEKIRSTIDGLYVFAGISHSGMISVESVTFFKYDGTTYYSGGAERYILDLDEVCREMNINYRVYQYAEYNWVRFYNGVEVVGLCARDNDVNVYSNALTNEMSDLFSRETAESGALNIYSPFYIINGKDRIPSIGISHGISWDSECNHFTNGVSFWQNNKNIIDSAENCDHMISVDTNTCNWFQTLNYDIGRKIRYVPNYVDNTLFMPRDDFEKLGEKIIITYPRRLYAARGLYVVLDALDEILERFPNVEFHFVGKGFEIDTKHVEEKIRRWGSRVKWYSKTPDTMYEVYRYTDIALVPTMYSEGTSLSCLEALSSGNAVICTRIGGLTDLILNGYNGLLVEPTGDAMKQAIIDLLSHPEKIVELKRNAVKTAQSFSKTQWKERWKMAIRQSVEGRQTTPYEESKRCWIELDSMDDLEKKPIQETVFAYLRKGWYVYLACKNNPQKVLSYNRLQLVDKNEDIYFTPELRITCKDICKTFH